VDRPPLAPHELLDDGFAPDPCDVLVIGCGNILCGDDAVGPTLIRQLVTQGVPQGVRVVDGGTAGMDVAFAMRGAARVVIVDASSTGADPGTVYRVPAHELADLPPVDGLHTHNFRWDHALSFSAWLLGPHQPSDITVFLVEAGSLERGAPLSAPVDAAMHRVAALIEDDFYPGSETPAGAPAAAAGADLAVGEVGAPHSVDITSEGYLHLPAALAAAHFGADVLLARREACDLVLVPLVSAEYGGLVLKRRNRAGDRSVLIHEVLGFAAVAGTFEVTWDEGRGALVVPLDGSGDDDRGADPGRGGARALGGLPRRPVGLGGGAQEARELPDAGAGPARGEPGATVGGTPPTSATGRR
jgi:hydrogenase maturation protease